MAYRKIPKISPGGFHFSKTHFEGRSFGGAYLQREICVFKIDWASLIAGSKFTDFALFYFVLEGSFPSTSPWGAYIWRGDLTEGFCVTGLGGLYLEGLIHGEAYFRNFTVLGRRYYFKQVLDSKTPQLGIETCTTHW